MDRLLLFKERLLLFLLNDVFYGKLLLLLEFLEALKPVVVSLVNTQGEVGFGSFEDGAETGLD